MFIGESIHTFTAAGTLHRRDAGVPVIDNGALRNQSNVVFGVGEKITLVTGVDSELCLRENFREQNSAGRGISRT